MSYRIVDVAQGSEEWKNMRFDYMTASRTPVLFGLSPYQTKLQLYTEYATRTERAYTHGQSTLFEIGHRAEILGREYVARDLGLVIPPRVVVSDTHPDLMASLDGFDEKKRVIFEAKYVGADALEDVKRGKLKPHHECQVQAQLLVAEAEECVYFALDPKGEAAVFRVRPDYALQKEIALAGAEFMASVRDGKEPEPGPQDFIELDDARLTRMAEIKAKIDSADTDIKGLQEELERLRDALATEHADKSRIRGAGLTLCRSIRRGSVDYKRIPQLRGVDLERYRAAAKEVVTLRWEKK